MRLTSSSPREVVLGVFTTSALVLTGCGSSSSSSSLTVDTPPTADDLIAFSRLTNIIPVQLEVAGTTDYGFIDTGNPWVLLDPSVFPVAAHLPSTGGTVSEITTSGLTVQNPFVLPSAMSDVMEGSGFDLRANVGCTVVCGQLAAFDYRAVSFTLGSSVAPSDVAAPISVDFTLAGGGTLQGTPVPTSRIVVPVTIEGMTLSMIVDSGASTVILSDAAYSALTADGRAMLDNGMTETTSGISDSSTTRAASIVVGGAEVQNAVVTHDTSFDSNLDEVSGDVGQTIDGSLGGTFLRNFFVTVDYPNEKLELAAYPDTSFLLDEGERLGIDLAIDSSGAFRVSTVLATDATLGITVGDTVIAIDGQELATISRLQAATLLYGPVGTLKMVAFGDAAKLAHQTVGVAVEELLPLPATTH